MAQSHSHDEGGHAGHDHTVGANARSLTIALGLTGTFLIAELVGAWLFNSLALLSDAAHMFTDAAALAIALAAIRIGRRPADDKRTYGYRRFEILAAAFNALLLFAVAAYVLYEGIQRFVEPQEVQSLGMLAVAAAGLVINLIAMRVLAGGKDESLNVKGAYLEVWADMLGSLGVIGAAILIYFTGWSWVDPIVAIAIGLWVLPRTWILLRDTTNILLQGVPRGVDLGAVRASIAKVEGVAEVHDLHLWSIAGSDLSLTAHVVLKPGSAADPVRLAVSEALHEEYDISHATLQMEADGKQCAEPEHDYRRRQRADMRRLQLEDYRETVPLLEQDPVHRMFEGTFVEIEGQFHFRPEGFNYFVPVDFLDHAQSETIHGDGFFYRIDAHLSFSQRMPHRMIVLKVERLYK